MNLVLASNVQTLAEKFPDADFGAPATIIRPLIN
jgi:hypothetical protein